MNLTTAHLWTTCQLFQSHTLEIPWHPEVSYPCCWLLTLHQHCPGNFSQMPMPQRMTNNLRNLRPILLRIQQVRSNSRKPMTLLKSRWITTNQQHRQMTLLSLLRPQDTPEPVIRSADQPSSHMQHITAKPWPTLASVPSSTSIRLPASDHLPQPSPNQVAIPTQCHSMWPCSNLIGISLLMPWHRSWVNTPN